MAINDAAEGVTSMGDADLVLRTRSGDTGAFGELWRRHYPSGLTVARSVTSTFDADDLVQEAYARIYQSILKGGGPTGSFRAYLFTSIRNTAAGWGRSRRETAIDALEAVEDPATSEQATAEALDRGLTHQAFRSLPSRWQEALWYSEIEQMKPSEIAPLLGLKPAAVSQLIFRAREGLREAWIQAHLQSVVDGSDCQWTIERLGSYARNNMGRRDHARLTAHLTECARCAIVASEAKDVSNRLALVLLPLAVGAAATAGYLATVQGGGVAVVALAAMPSAALPGAVTVAPAAVGLTAAGAGSGAASAGAAGITAGAAGAAGAGSVGITAGASATAGAGAAVGGAAASSAAGTFGVAAGGALSSVGAAAGLVTAGLVVAGTVLAATLGLPAIGPSTTDEASTSIVETTTSSTVDGAGSLPGDVGSTTTPADGTTAGAAGSSAADQGDEGTSGSSDDGSPALLPSGVPSAGAPVTTFSQGRATVALPVSGLAGAIVRAVYSGNTLPDIVLDDAGLGVVTVVTTMGELNTRSNLVLAYAVGDAVGETVTIVLGDLPGVKDAIRANQGNGNANGNNGKPNSNANENAGGAANAVDGQANASARSVPQASPEPTAVAITTETVDPSPAPTSTPAE